MSSRALIVLGFLFAAFLLISSEEVSKELEKKAAEDVGVEDAKYGRYPGGGYGRGGNPGRGYGGYPGRGYGGYPGHGSGGYPGRGGGHGRCSYGCCGGRGYYGGGCRQCCRYPGQVHDSETQTQPQN